LNEAPSAGPLPRFDRGLACRLGLALVSGYCAWPAGLLGDQLEELLPLPFSSWTNILVGALFGVLVLAPRVTGQARRGVRIAALVVAAILIYTLAVWLAVINWGPLHLNGRAAVMASGVLGACLVTGAAILWAPLRAPRIIWAWAVAAGLVGGAVFHYAISADTGPAALVIGTGYAVWQVLVAVGLENGARAAAR
jgi:hypothetical protein